jgi:hypothetical protein
MPDGGGVEPAVGIALALRSAAGRSAEEWVSEDWAAVSKAINRRMAELGVSQRELIERAQVSKAIVGEIQHNTTQRRRSARTLEALSLALDWHPGHLAAVLAGHRPPAAGEPAPRSAEDVPGRLAVIEHQLREIVERLDEIDSLGDQLADIKSSISTVLNHVQPNRGNRKN